MKKIDNVEEKLSDLLAENKVLKKIIYTLSSDNKQIVNDSIKLAIERDKKSRKGLIKVYELFF